MHLQIPTRHHTVTDQKPTRSPRPRSRLQPSRTWRLESVIAEFDFEMEEPRGKMPRRAETSESVAPFHLSEAISSELQQVSTAAANVIT